MDGCFQTVTPSLYAGDKSAMNAILVPAIIDSLVINPMTARPDVAISVTQSRYTGRGRSDESKTYKSGCSVYDPVTGALLLQLTGLHYHKLETGDESGATSTYNHSVWRPDISFLTQKQLHYLPKSISASGIDDYLDLLAHKTPALKVMEVNLYSSDTSSVWFQSQDQSSRAAYQHYSFLCSNPQSLISVQSKYEAERSTSFSLVDLTEPNFVPVETNFDLVIIKFQQVFKGDLQNIARNSRAVLADGGHLLFIEQIPSTVDSDSDDSDMVVVASDSESQSSWLSNMVTANGFGNALELPCDNVKSAYLYTAEVTIDDEAASTMEVSVAHLSQDARQSWSINEALKASGWSMSEHCYPFAEIRQQSIVLVLDELYTPALTEIAESQWTAIKKLMECHCKIIWVTQGSQLEVTKPDGALVHGLFRTIRAEDPSLNLTTLDVEVADTVAAAFAIERVLSRLRRKHSKVNVDSELVERGGTIHVNRILPDNPMNMLRREKHGPEPVIRSLHGIETVARLRAERLGTLDELRFAETSLEEVPVKANNVEVEIFAAGLNFKVGLSDIPFVSFSR